MLPAAFCSALGMARCFCAMGLTEHAARDPETLRREVESTYRQLSRRTHPDRVGLAFPSQDFLFLTTVKDRCLAKIMQRETKCTLFEHKVRGGGFTPPPAGGGLTPPPAASYSGAGAAPPWAAGSNNHGPRSSPRWNACFTHGRHGLAGHCRLPFLRLQGGVWMVPTHCNLQELQHLGGHELADQRKLYQIAGRNERKALVPGAQGPVGKLLVPGVLQ